MQSDAIANRLSGRERICVKGLRRMLVKHALTEAEYVAAVRYTARPKTSGVLGWIGLLCISSLIFLSLSSNEAHPTPFSAFWAGLGAFSCFVLCLYAWSYYKTIKSARYEFHSTPAIRLETSFDVEQDEYWACTGCRGLKLEDHVMWLKSRDGIFLFTHRSIFHFVPFRLASDGIDFDHLVKRLEQYVGAKGQVKADSRSLSAKTGSFFGMILVWVLIAFMLVFVYNLLFARR